MNLEGFQIIPPEVYTNSSLDEDIDYLSNPENTIDTKTIINMIVKYIFCYYDAYYISSNIAYKKIINFFKVINEHEASIGNNDRFNNHKGISEEMLYKGLFDLRRRYSMTMGMDVASTTVIVKDIISRTISPESFESRYLGLDLGSGIGILTLAQCIQAIRNKFDSIENIGIEINEATNQFSREVLRRLYAGKIYNLDSTRPILYENIILPEEKITFISNETLPDPNVAISAGDITNDPFVLNNINLFTYGKSNIGLETQFFPKEVIVKKVNIFKKEYLVGNKQNAFLAHKIKDESNSIFYTKSIKIGEDYIELIKMGDKVIESGEVNKNPYLRARWGYDKVVKN